MRAAGLPRGAALNAAARRAHGDVLLFLHADTRLPAGAAADLAAALAAPDVAGGAFSLSFGTRRFPLGLIAFAANLRARRLKLPYGDQALFVRRGVFGVLGGFQPWPLMDDVDFARRLAALAPVAILPSVVTTSPRRYRRDGPFRRTALNLALVLRYAAGADPERLALAYRIGAGENREPVLAGG